MLFRIVIGLGLLGLGYYVGREMRRGEPIRRELESLREEEQRKKVAAQPPASRPPATKPRD
jgi:hypothetical protein